MTEFFFHWTSVLWRQWSAQYCTVCWKFVIFFFENLWRHPFWFLDDIVKFRLKSFDWSPSVEGVNILFNFKRDLMWFFWNLKKILKLSQKKNIMLKINYLIPRWPFVDRSNRLSGFFDVGLKLAHFKLHVRNL